MNGMLIFKQSTSQNVTSPSLSWVNLPRYPPFVVSIVPLCPAKPSGVSGSDFTSFSSRPSPMIPPDVTLVMSGRRGEGLGDDSGDERVERSWGKLVVRFSKEDTLVDLIYTRIKKQA